MLRRSWVLSVLAAMAAPLVKAGSGSRSKVFDEATARSALRRVREAAAKELTLVESQFLQPTANGLRTGTKAYDTFQINPEEPVNPAISVNACMNEIICTLNDRIENLTTGRKTQEQLTEETLAALRKLDEENA